MAAKTEMCQVKYKSKLSFQRSNFSKATSLVTYWHTRRVIVQIFTNSTVYYLSGKVSRSAKITNVMEPYYLNIWIKTNTIITELDWSISVIPDPPRASIKLFLARQMREHCASDIDKLCISDKWNITVDTIGWTDKLSISMIISFSTWSLGL